MEFCPNCDNVFNYDEDIDNRTLKYFCNNCDIHAPIKDNCLSTKTMKKDKQTFIYYNDAIYDPTLPTRESECPKCKHPRACYILKENLNIVFICKNEKCRNIYS